MAEQLDALLPAEMAAKAEIIGVRKAGLDATRTFVLAVLAGAFIALGAVFSTTIGAVAESFWQTIAKTPADYPQLTIHNFVFGNLLPVTIGNVIGGALLVGIVYWFVYLRQEAFHK